MLSSPDLEAPAVLGISGIWIESQLEMAGTKLAKAPNKSPCSDSKKLNKHYMHLFLTLELG